MNVGLYQAAAAMKADARWQEVISENLSASSIPGFKKQTLSFGAIQAGLMAQGRANCLATSDRYSLPQASTATNFRAGELRSTGSPTDVAIEGPGFFEVQLPDGKHAFTRDGEFQLNGQGQLVTKQGDLVLGEAGPLQLDPNAPEGIVIAPTGEVSQKGEVSGRLKIAEFSDPSLLAPTESGYFFALDPRLQRSDAAAPNLRQGFLEGANTTPVMEMANLITALRMYEANQRVVQAQDDRMGRAITDLGNPT